MNGNKNIISLIELLVSSMTPVLTIDLIETVGVNFKLSSTNTYWLTNSMTITIDSIDYKIVSFVQNDHIVLSGSTLPTATEFQLKAPEFWHGSSRKVDQERNNIQDKRDPFVYLPKPNVVPDYKYDSEIAYEASIRPIFLTNFNPQKDTIDLQQTDIIEPMNSMADLFIQLVQDDFTNFDDPTSGQRKEWMNFGDETVWGNDEQIFDENLSGVEAPITIPVLSTGKCDDNQDFKVCADVKVSFNGGSVSPVLSGGTKKVQVINKDEPPINVGAIVTDTTDELVIEVDAVDLVRIYLRPLPTGQTVSYEDYDDAWKVINNSDTYTPPESGIPMVVDPENVWKVLPDNLWGHKWRICGSTGGYYNNVLDDYFDVDGNPTTYALAYPNDKMFDHSTGIQWVNTVLTKKTVSNASDNIYVQMNAYTNDGESGYFVGNSTENESIRDLGIQWAFYNQPPFDQIGAANKWSSTTAAYSSSTGYSNRITGELTGTSKGTSQFTIPMKYALP